MRVSNKDWDRHVVEAEELARGRGFREIRDAILRRAEPRASDRALDVGAGTGLLTLALAARVSCVWALDISPAMSEYLRVKSSSAGIKNVEPVVGSALSLPLVDESVELVVSNYCLHHLDAVGKVRALTEIRRVLVPGGRLVFGDMMFGIGLLGRRDRKVVSQKVTAMLRKGPAGVFRLGKNAGRLLRGRWERPARPEWWRQALADAGFSEVVVEPMPHEGGIAAACRPAVAASTRETLA